MRIQLELRQALLMHGNTYRMNLSSISSEVGVNRWKSSKGVLRAPVSFDAGIGRSMNSFAGLLLLSFLPWSVCALIEQLRRNDSAISNALQPIREFCGMHRSGTHEAVARLRKCDMDPISHANDFNLISRLATAPALLRKIFLGVM